MKCISSLNLDGKPPRCPAEAQYIYLGKSYCAEHMEIHSEENTRILEAGKSKVDLAPNKPEQ